MKPTDDTIALVAFLLGRSWLTADEIRHGIARLGFDMPSSQWVVARLTAMTKESAPRFERGEESRPWSDYKVTHWAANGLSNNWGGFWTLARGVSGSQGVFLSAPPAPLLATPDGTAQDPRASGPPVSTQPSSNPGEGEQT